MTSRVMPNDWRPSGINDFEPNAWDALRCHDSISVVAGPGAGKTEFLAQRAVYLLQTGICPAPYQILAISFKADAAKNLADRVKKRCPPQLAQRFVSITFDAFTKSLVDRFHGAIPVGWQPTRPYSIVFPRPTDVRSFLEEASRAAPQEWRAGVMALNVSTFESHHVGSQRFDAERVAARSPAQFASQRWLDQRLAGTPSRLTFICINRLAELLIRSSPHLAKALRATYPFVFVDEFQDTTFAQYDFLHSAFYRSGTSVTAVGDHKQRIMGWAGARNDAFEQFETDFAARRIQLLYNFRSAPVLVQIQNVVAQALDAGSIAAQSQAHAQLDHDVVQIWSSTSLMRESNYLAAWLVNDMARRGKTASDYVLLVRQKAEEFADQLKEPFAAVGLRIRNESRILGQTSVQDLLSDEMIAIGVALLRLGSGERDANTWERASAAVHLLRASEIDDEVRFQQIDRELNTFLAQLRANMAANVPSDGVCIGLVNQIFEFLDVESVGRTFIQYARNDLFAIMQEGFRLYIGECARSAQSWNECLDAFEGIDQIPLMTVHKSKGLEFDTVAFIGMDDSSWWSHTQDNPEGIATFFVALSRAKQRAIFLFCQARGTRARVADLYQLLTDAGVPETPI
jgi:superfamily I DNA/RNA helicase